MSSYILFSQTSTPNGTRDKWVDAGDSGGKTAPGNPVPGSTFSADKLGSAVLPDAAAVADYAADGVRKTATTALFDISQTPGGAFTAQAASGVSTLETQHTDGGNKLFAGNNTKLNTSKSDVDLASGKLWLAVEDKNWDAIKNLEIKLDGDATFRDIRLENFVDTRLQITGELCDIVPKKCFDTYDVRIIGAKRGEVDASTATDNLKLDLQIYSDSKSWQNSFDIKGTAYADVVLVGAGTVGSSYGYCKPGQSAYDGADTKIFANLGAGNDLFDSTNVKGDALKKYSSWSHDDDDDDKKHSSRSKDDDDDDDDKKHSSRSKDDDDDDDDKKHSSRSKDDDDDDDDDKQHSSRSNDDDDKSYWDHWFDFCKSGYDSKNEFRSVDKVWGGTGDDCIRTGGGDDILFGDNGSGANFYADPASLAHEISDNFLTVRLDGQPGPVEIGFNGGNPGYNAGSSFDAGDYIIQATGGNLMQLRTGPAPHAGGLGIRSLDDPPAGPPLGNGDPLGSAEIDRRGTDEAITFDFKTAAHYVEIDINAFWDNEGALGTSPEIVLYTVFLTDGTSFADSVIADNHVFPANFTISIGEDDTGGKLIDKVTLAPSAAEGEFSDFFVAELRACTVIPGAEGNDKLDGANGADFFQGDGDRGILKITPGTYKSSVDLRTAGDQIWVGKDYDRDVVNFETGDGFDVVRQFDRCEDLLRMQGTTASVTQQLVNTGEGLSMLVQDGLGGAVLLVGVTQALTEVQDGLFVRMT